MAKPNFAILRTEKLKSAASIRGAVGHNSRTRETPNADPSGKIHAIVDSGIDPYEAVMSKIESAGAKHRSNSVLAQEVLLTASPEYFREQAPENAGYWDNPKAKAWYQSAKEWLFDQFGDRIASAHLHLDEATPHIHAVVVPLTEDNRLSAREIFNKKSLSDMQTSYANSLENLGIKRGIKGSKAKHMKVKQFYKLVNKPFPEKFSPDDIAHVAIKGNASEIHRRKAEEYQRTADEMRAESARVRQLPLKNVLDAFGGFVVDENDKNQVKGNGMRISINGNKWFDHDGLEGGGGAIDLAKYLTGSNFKDAVSWLGGYVEVEDLKAETLSHMQELTAQALVNPVKSAPPKRNDVMLNKVRWYLHEERGIDYHLIEWLIKNQYLYADDKGNCVFAYGDGDSRGEGVELRGTNPGKSFHGFRGEKGYFLLPTKKGVQPNAIAITEGAIDALSFRQLSSYVGDDATLVASVAGGVSDTVLQSIVDKAIEDGLSITLAFDQDDTGRGYAARLYQIAEASGLSFDRIERAEPLLRPENEKWDWNDELVNFDPYEYFDQEPENEADTADFSHNQEM